MSIDLDQNFAGPEIINNHFYEIRILLFHAHSNSTLSY